MQGIQHKALIFFTTVYVWIFLFVPLPSFAQSPNEYFRAEVVRLVEKGQQESLDVSAIVQQVRLRVLSGSEERKEVTAQNNIVFSENTSAVLKEGDSVVGLRSATEGADVDYYVVDYNRTLPLTLIFLSFFFLSIR